MANLRYPTPVKMRSGAKVGWLYYRTKEEAVKASYRAKSRAKLLAAQGYDFGYLTPGTIRETDGLWEVVIP